MRGAVSGVGYSRNSITKRTILKILYDTDIYNNRNNPIDMNNWITAPKTLTGHFVALISLERIHFHELEKLAKDKRIWTHYTYDGSDSKTFRRTLELAMVEQQKGTQFPFIIYHKTDKRFIGSTRFMDMQPTHKKLEIGTTWLLPDYWGTAVNLECKLLLLTFCFETLQTYRVQLKTDENNKRSRRAIEKIGGQFEGILRSDMVRDNGTKRNSAYFSILNEEWPEVRVRLTSLVENHLQKTNNTQ
jgi:N-acetyltransferase